VLELDIVDAVHVGQHLWHVENLERPGGTRRLRRELEDRVEVERHHRDARKLLGIGLPALLRPHGAADAQGAGGRRRSKKLTTSHLALPL